MSGWRELLYGTVSYKTTQKCRCLKKQEIVSVYFVLINVIKSSERKKNDSFYWILKYLFIPITESQLKIKVKDSKSNYHC